MGKERRAKEIGYLVGWTINRSKRTWNAELHAQTDDADTAELRAVISLLYIRAGTARATYRSERFADLLKADTVVFIDTLKLNPAYRGIGLAQLALQSFHNLVANVVGREQTSHLPRAVVVPSPARSESAKINNGKTDVQVEQALIRSYGKSGYDVWIKGDENVDGTITVMGREV